MPAMPYMTPANAYPHRSGHILLGLDQDGGQVGYPLERMALTIAASGAGKGATLLIPNARLWAENLLVVDPKGEVAAASWREREALGQAVHVLDPFAVADIPERLRATFNPLAAISAESPTGREDLEVIADGLVKRSDPRHEEWYEGAASLLAGLMAYVCETAPPDRRSLAGLRSLLLEPNERLYEHAQHMLDAVAFGGLAKAAGVTLMSGIEAEKGMEKDFIQAARRYTKWMDSPPIAATLAASSFDLSALKTGSASLFLVLPPQYIETHAAFLRLFVRSAINAMMRDGAQVRRRCLFMLDEFYSLGRLDVVAKSMGLMRGYGLHLWPFLQDIGQLQSLYDARLSETFFANADIAAFFGNDDMQTLGYISRRLGNLTPNEVRPDIPKMTEYPNQTERTAHANDFAQYEHDMRRVGSPRLSPEEVARLIAKPAGAKVAKRAVVFLRGGEILLPRLWPHFLPMPEVARPAPPVAADAVRRSGWPSIPHLLLLGLAGLWTALCAWVGKAEGIADAGGLALLAAFWLFVAGPAFFGFLKLR